MPKGFKHGFRYGPEYQSWLNAKARCHNTNHPRYAEWGGRGIEVCAEWRSDFKKFLEHVGHKPAREHTLDRIDGSRGYEPGNVRWSTKSEQSRNRPGFVRSIEFRGKTVCLSELAAEVGMNREKLKYRLDKGWPIEKVITP